jgi:hypothetical protein
MACREDDETSGKRFTQMLMKRLLMLALVTGVCVAMADPSLAIEKRKKDTPPPTQPQSQSQTASATDTLKTAIQRMTPPIFNDFIDVNKNGIDDRREQGGNLVPPKQVPKTPVVAKKADSIKTVTPKPSAEKPQKKGK